MVSRFASGILEALARGKLPVYFNPHGEKVDKFKNPMNAYPIANSEFELQDILGNLNFYYDEHFEYFEGFIGHHCGNLKLNPSYCIVQMINNIIGDMPKYDFDHFFIFLNFIDKQTLSFENRRLLESIILNFDDSIVGVSKEDIFSLCLSEFKKENYIQVEKYLNCLKSKGINYAIINRLKQLKNNLEHIGLSKGGTR